MADEKKPGPDYLETKKLPAMTDRALLEDLARTVKDGFAGQNTQLLAFGERLVTLEDSHRDVERRMYEFEGRLIRNSSRVKHVSDSDLTQEAKLADVIVWRQNVETALADTKSLAEKAVETVAVVERKTDAQTAELAKQTSMLNTLTKGWQALSTNPLVVAIAAAAGTVVLGWLRGCH